MDISVIIPMYNAQNTITTCIESVVNSCVASNLLWEIVVVNDGSSDSSVDVITAYIEASDYSNQITLLSQSNKGVSSARNTGMSVAKGMYIAFNDADDKWTVEHLSLLIKVLEENPQAELVAGVYDSDNVSLIKRVNQLTHISIADQMKKNYFAPPTLLICQRVLNEIDPFCEDMRYFEDYRFVNQIVHRGSAYIIPQTITHPITNKHRWGEAGLSGNLWAMERGELAAIKAAYESCYITRTHYMLTVALSIAKFMRRIAITGYRNLFAKQR